MTSWLEEPNCESWNLSMSFMPVPFSFFTSLRFRVISFLCLRSWVSLVSKNYEIERAIIQLENEVATLKQQQGEENKENIQQDF